MTYLVDPEIIEERVGRKRHPTKHYGRVRGTNVFILHSHACKDSGIDLRECRFSKALDNGAVNIPAGRPHVLWIDSEDKLRAEEY